MQSLYDKYNTVRFSIFLPGFHYIKLDKKYQTAFYQDIPTGNTLGNYSFENPFKDYKGLIPDNGKYLMCLILWQDPDQEEPVTTYNPSVEFSIKIQNPSD